MLLLSFRNIRESLGEQGILWKQGLEISVSTAFSSSLYFQISCTGSV